MEDLTEESYRLEPRFEQVFKDWGRLDQLKFALFQSGVARFVFRNIAPSVDRSCSFGMNGSDPEQISEQQRVKNFPECCKHLE